MRVEDLEVYQKLCRLHIDVCRLSRQWPAEERCELGSRMRRASKSAPASLAEKHSDRPIRNKVEGVNRARGEALERVRHLFIAHVKGYVSEEVYLHYRARYEECVRIRSMTVVGPEP
jgi:four helix bundle protein